MRQSGRSFEDTYMEKPHMSLPRTILRECVVLLVLALMLGACYRADNSSQYAQYEEPAGTSAQAIESTKVNDNTAAADDGLPLSEFLGYDHGSPQATAEHYAILKQEQGLVVAACMRQHGFEYIDNVIEEQNFLTYQETEFADYSDEWVAKYGFGVSTLRWSQDEVGTDLVGYPGPTKGDPNRADPNDDYLEGLTEGERDAWNVALFGADLDEPGCFDDAYKQVFGPIDAIWEAFGDEVATLYDRVLADPRVVHYFQQVSSCVADAGFDWDASQEAWQYFEPKLRDLGDEPDITLTGDEIDAMSDAELQALLSSPFGLTDEDKERLADVQAEELVLAQIVHGCGGGYLDQDDALTQIFVEYERQFVDQNAKKLTALRNG